MLSCHNGIKLEINSKEVSGKCSNIWKLNSIPLHANGSKKVTRKIRKYFEINENGNATYPNLQDVNKAMHREKHTVTQAYIGNKGQSKMNSLTIHYWKLGDKKNKSKPK